MSKIYSRAPDALVDKVAEVMATYCPDLAQNSVRIDCLTIANSDEDSEEPPLLLHGYACAAIVRIQGAKDRAKGLGDAEIIFDEEAYNDLPEASQVALIHHELHHLELQRSPKGKVQLDDYRRPKMKMRLHDRQLGWFDEIARIHGPASMEVRTASKLVLSGKQLYFEFALNGGRIEEAAAQLVA